MQFTKPMIELVYEIRRRVPSDLKPSIKLANPELLQMLISCYQTEKLDAVCRALIKDLMSQAGDSWPSRLEMAPKASVSSRMVAKAYRGTVSHIDAPADPSKSASPSKPVRIYRGRVVND